MSSVALEISMSGSVLDATWKEEPLFEKITSTFSPDVIKPIEGQQEVRR